MDSSKKSIKILIAINHSFSANFIKGQGRYLREKGHEVVIVSGPGPEVDDLEIHEKIKVIRHPFSREISLFRDLKSLWAVIKIVWKEKPDIINAGNPKTGFLFSLAHLFFWKTPVIFTLRGLRSDTLTGFKKRIVRLTEKISCLLANRVIVISPSLKDHVVSIGIVKEAKCVVLGKGSSNGIDVEYFKQNPLSTDQGKEILRKHQIPPDSTKIIFVGRVTRDKGIGELIDAFEELKSSALSLSLIIAGPIEKDDPLSDHYYQKLKENPQIFYIGKQRDVRPVYSIADILVLFSHREGFGNVVIEAASMGVPAIVADIPGLRDTIEDNITGFHVPANDTKALVKTIRFYIDHPEVAQQHSVNGIKRIHANFTNEAIWEGQLSLYKSLVDYD